MNLKRRKLVGYATLFGLMASAGLISSAQAQEWSKAAFDAKSLDEAYRSLGAAAPEKSSGITLTVPDLSENGALVPVTVSAELRAQQIAILVEKNPSALVAQFFLQPGAEPFITTRIKMAQSSQVYALVKIDSKWFFTNKEVKVTLGGCGS